MERLKDEARLKRLSGKNEPRFARNFTRRFSKKYPMLKAEAKLHFYEPIVR